MKSNNEEALNKKSVTFVTLGSDLLPSSGKCNEKPIHFFSILDPFLSTLGKNYFFPLKSPPKYEKSAQKWVKKAEKQALRKFSETAKGLYWQTYKIVDLID